MGLNNDGPQLHKGGEYEFAAGTKDAVSERGVDEGGAVRPQVVEGDGGKVAAVRDVLDGRLGVDE